MKSILDPAFRYTPSFSTDLRKTFARVRDELHRPPSPRPREVAAPHPLPTPLMRRHAQP